MAKATKLSKNAEETNPPKKSRGGDRRSKVAKKSTNKRERTITHQLTISANECRIPFKSLRIEKNEIVFTI